MDQGDGGRGRKSKGGHGKKACLSQQGTKAAREPGVEEALAEEGGHGGHKEEEEGRQEGGGELPEWLPLQFKPQDNSLQGMDVKVVILNLKVGDVKIFVQNNNPRPKFRAETFYSIIL